MNDWSYGCVAKLLAARDRRRPRTRPTATGDRQPRHRERRAVSLARATAFQRRQHVLDQIVGMLEPARQPHQPVADAELGALLPASSRWCVVVAGWVIRLLASPRLLEMRTSLSASWKRKAPFLPPSTSNATSVEPPRICFCDDRGLRMVRPAGIDQPRHLRMLGERLRDRRRGVGLPRARAPAASPVP